MGTWSGDARQGVRWAIAAAASWLSEADRDTLPQVAQIPLGGTATGTGLRLTRNSPPRCARRWPPDRPSPPRQDPFEAEGNRDALVELSGALKVVAVSLIKIAGDLALMGSAPRRIGRAQPAGAPEGLLDHARQGHPVIPEVVLQVGAQVIGNDTAITIGGLQGQFELNVRILLMAREPAAVDRRCPASTSKLFAEKCVDGIEPNLPGLEASAEANAGRRDRANPYIGDDKAAEIVKDASASGGTLREVARKHGVDEETLDKALDLRKIAAGSSAS